MLAREVVMVRPAAFGYDPETAETNKFQSAFSCDPAQVLAEFDGVVAALRQAGVTVHVVQDSPDPAKPNAIFPNNVISFHRGEATCLYPMATASRRIERTLHLERFSDQPVLDLTRYEARGKHLEGTGSLVLDRNARRAWVCWSERSHPEVAAAWGREMNYEIIGFEAVDRGGFPIYHTNVVLSVGPDYAVIGRENLVDESVLDSFADRALIELDQAQIEHFAGNMLALGGASGTVILASQTAVDSLRDAQIAALESHGQLVVAAIPTIEQVGGGSVRCMVCELFR